MQNLATSELIGDEELQKIDFELQQRQKFWPIRDVVPNIAQRRCLKPYLQPHPTYVGKYPFIKIFRAGNGCGKTCVMAWLLCGVALGSDYMNPEYFYHEYFKFCEKIRKKRRLKVRIVCKQVDAQENGSVYQEISKWIPVAKFGAKTSGNYYTSIRIPAPSKLYFETVVDIKTFDQDPVTHAGPDYDLILINEPAPQDIYNENVGRCRRGGRIAIFLTPLNQAEYLRKIEDGDYPDGEVDVTVARIWDNCCEIPGTDGILTRIDIEKQIRQWRENNELEVPAREDGQYMHMSGAVYPIFNQDIHVVPPMVIDPKWNIYKIIDPHESKPPFCVWIAVTPMNECYIIAEYPTQIWTMINSTYLTISNFCNDFRAIESGKNEKFPYIRDRLVIDECIGDPNRFKCRHSNTGLTIQQEYEDNGCESINLKINDDIALRHDRVRKLLYYDPMREAKSPNRPKMFVFSSCKNVIRAFKNYQYKSKQSMAGGMTDKIDMTHGCPMDCVGYFAVDFECWVQKKIENYDDYGSEIENNVENGMIEGYISSSSPFERFI